MNNALTYNTESLNEILVKKYFENSYTPSDILPENDINIPVTLGISKESASNVFYIPVILNKLSELIIERLKTSKIESNYDILKGFKDLTYRENPEFGFLKEVTDSDADYNNILAKIYQYLDVISTQKYKNTFIVESFKDYGHKYEIFLKSNQTLEVDALRKNLHILLGSLNEYKLATTIKLEEVYNVLKFSINKPSHKSSVFIGDLLGAKSKKLLENYTSNLKEGFTKTNVIVGYDSEFTIRNIDLNNYGTISVQGVASSGKSNFLHQLVYTLGISTLPSESQILVYTSANDSTFKELSYLPHVTLCEKHGNPLTVFQSILEVFKERLQLLYKYGVSNFKEFKDKFDRNDILLNQMPKLTIMYDMFSEHSRRTLTATEVFEVSNIIKMITEQAKELGITFIYTTKNTKSDYKFNLSPDLSLQFFKEVEETSDSRTVDRSSQESKRYLLDIQDTVFEEAYRVSPPAIAPETTKAIELTLIRNVVSVWSKI